MKKLILSLLFIFTAIYANAQLRVNPGGEVTIGSTPSTITEKLMVDGSASVKSNFTIINPNNTSNGWGAKLRFMPSNGTTPNHIIVDNGQNEMIIQTGFQYSGSKKLTVKGDLDVSRKAKIRTSLDIINLDNTGTQWGGQLRFMPNVGTKPNHLIIDKGQNEMIIHTGYNAASPSKLTLAGDLYVSKTAKVNKSLDILNKNNHAKGWGGYLNFSAADGTGANHTMIDNGPSQFLLKLDPKNLVPHSEFLVVSELNTFRGYTNMAGGSNLSDRRLKQNINTLNYGLETLLQLNPVSYEWNPNEHSKLTSQKELSEHFQGTQVGFIAQEVEALIPEVVKEGSDGYKSLEYHNLTAVIVKAVKEQQVIIEAQKLAIEELSQQMEQLKNQTNKTDLLDSEKVFLLEQNRPNPFSVNTSIKYSTPKNGQLLITNLAGKTFHSIDLNAGKNKTLEVSAQKLDNGIYIYSIVVEGELKLSKRFVVTK